MARVFSGIQPSGDLHLGNYLGALRDSWTTSTRATRSSASSTCTHSPFPRTRPSCGPRPLELANLYLACGLDPDVCTLFVQSHVHEHTELAWLLECTASFGELRRMTQFKDKSESAEFVSAGLFTYPVLMAADILLYDTDGCRWATTSASTSSSPATSRCGSTPATARRSWCPKAAIPRWGPGSWTSRDPTAKMSKSAESPQGTVLLLDPPDVIERKIKRAVTDTERRGALRPGEPSRACRTCCRSSGAATGEDPAALAGQYTSTAR